MSAAGSLSTEAGRRTEVDMLSSLVQDRVQSGAVKLPLLPQVAGQVIALLGNPNVDAARLSALIHRDPGMAGQILRVANSPAYAPRMPIVSLQQAVARLGLNALGEIAFSISLQSGTFKVPGHEKDLQRLWRHALASGAWGKEIARSRRSNIESAFLCGLLHEVGKPALLQTIVDVATELGLEHNTPRVRALLELHHAAVGRRIAEAWSLPGAVAASIVHYREPSAAGPYVHDVLVTCLGDRLATWLVDAQPAPAGTGEAAGDEGGDLDIREQPVFAELNFYPDEVEALLGKRDAVLATVEAMTL